MVLREVAQPDGTVVWMSTLRELHTGDHYAILDDTTEVRVSQRDARGRMGSMCCPSGATLPVRWCEGLQVYRALAGVALEIPLTALLTAHADSNSA